MSNEERRFIQSAIIQLASSHPSFQTKPNPQSLVKAAEKLWQIASSAGYGTPASKEAKPRKGKDWYSELSEPAQIRFCRFWEAFRYKQGRNEAAQSWALLGGKNNDGKYLGPDHDLSALIIEAAGKDALRTIPQGQVRKMAQGWLSERRWEDAAPITKPGVNKDQAAKTERINEARQDVAHWKRMMEVQKIDEAKSFYESAKAKLDKLLES